MGILGNLLTAGAWAVPIGFVVFAAGLGLRAWDRRWSRPARLLRTWGAGACLEGLLLAWFFFSHIDGAPETELTIYLVLLALVPAVVLTRTIMLVRNPKLTLTNLLGL